MSLTCKVQYLNDIDPFSYNYLDPARPPLHTFNVTLPLINQLAAIHRLLKSPHREQENVMGWLYIGLHDCQRTGKIVKDVSKANCSEIKKNLSPEKKSKMFNEQRQVNKHFTCVCELKGVTFR